jgi:hypothetical protein
MPGKILLSTAYLPPAEYFFNVLNADEVIIEKEENYIKQTYRNRCYILSSGGLLLLTVPVYLGSFHKTPVKDIRIDYSKRWQQVHIRALTASYASSPFFMFYFEAIEKTILNHYSFLLDLNTDLLKVIMEILKIPVIISYTKEFIPAVNSENDFRYRIFPKRKSEHFLKKYPQVFPCPEGFIPKLSIVDLVFNLGPEAKEFLKSTP